MFHTAFPPYLTESPPKGGPFPPPPLLKREWETLTIIVEWDGGSKGNKAYLSPGGVGVGLSLANRF